MFSKPGAEEADDGYSQEKLSKPKVWVIFFNFGLKTSYLCRLRIEIVWHVTPSPAESSWWLLCHTKAARRQMDTDQKAKHQPGGMMGCGGVELWGRPERWTDRGRQRFLWSAGSLWIRLYFQPNTSELVSHIAHYQTNETPCKTEGLHISPSHNLHGLAAPICRCGIPFTHGQSVPYPRFLSSVTTGCRLLLPLVSPSFLSILSPSL